MCLYINNRQIICYLSYSRGSSLLQNKGSFFHLRMFPLQMTSIQTTMSNRSSCTDTLFSFELLVPSYSAFSKFLLFQLKFSYHNFLGKRDFLNYLIKIRMLFCKVAEKGWEYLLCCWITGKFSFSIFTSKVTFMFCRKLFYLNWIMRLLPD